MAIKGVPSSNVTPPRQKKRQMPETEATKALAQSLKSCQDENKNLLDSVKQSQLDIAAVIESTNDRIEEFNDFLDQFQEVLDLDRDGIQAAAKEMGLEGVKSNSADRDVLSMIFKHMRATMLTEKAEGDNEPEKDE